MYLCLTLLFSSAGMGRRTTEKCPHSDFAADLEQMPHVEVSALVLFSIIIIISDYKWRWQTWHLIEMENVVFVKHGRNSINCKYSIK